MAIKIDCDSHFTPRDIFDDVDPRFGRRRPRQWIDAQGRSLITYPEREEMIAAYQRQGVGVFTGAFASDSAASWTSAHASNWDPENRLAYMDRLGMDMQVLITGGSPFAYDVDPELGASVCQSHNNAIARVIEKYQGRFIGLAQIPMQDPERAVEEIERSIGELSLHGVAMFTNVAGRNLDEPEFWPVYAKIEELDVPLILHGSRSAGMLGLERMTKFHLDNTLGFLWEGTSAITSLITGGVLDLFPRLRIGLTETMCGYLPHLMERLDELYDEEINGVIKKRPRDYVDQFWMVANTLREKKGIPHFIETFGASRLMVGTDFPHGLGGSGEATVESVLTHPDLTDEQKDQILGLNAAELFRIPIDTNGDRN